MAATDTVAAARILPVRRALRLPEAAAYVGVGQTKFLSMVDDGRMPQAVRIDGCVLWDVRALDEAFDRLVYASPAQGARSTVGNAFD